MKRLRRSVRPLALAAVPVVLLAFGACSSRLEKNEEAERIEECEAYAQSYQRCLTRLGQGTEGAERASAMAARFAPPKEESARADLKERCIAGMRRLEASCR